MEAIANRYGDSSWSEENILKLDCGDGCTTVNIIKTPELCTLKGYFKGVNLHELYPKKAIIAKNIKLFLAPGPQQK